MPDPSEESAILNLDSGNTIAGICQAIRSYARTVPDAAVAKITFEQTPDVENGGIWEARALLKCLGGLERTATPSPSGEDFLENVEPKVVHTQAWHARGLGFAGAVEGLRDAIEEHLELLIIQREQDLQTASEALKILRNPNELDTMWSTSDNPEDESAQESK